MRRWCRRRFGISGDLASAKSGDIRGALKDYGNATSILESLLANSPTNAQVRRDLLAAYLGFGDTQLLAGNRPAAMQFYLKAKPIAEELAAGDPHNIQAHADLATLYLSLSAWETANTNLLGALENCRHAVAIREELLSPNNALTQRKLAIAYIELAKIYEKLATDRNVSSDQQRDNLRAARDWYQKSLDIWQEMKDHGKIAGADAQRPEEIARALAHCDARLK